MTKPLRYLLDNFMLLHRDKLADNYGQPIRLSGDERQLLNDVLAFLESTYEARSSGGKLSSGGGRPRKPDSEVSLSALYQRKRRARIKGI